MLNPEEPYWSWREGPPGCRHRRYIQLASPYYGMYTATPKQLVCVSFVLLGH